jgi:hypothetical protein
MTFFCNRSCKIGRILSANFRKFFSMQNVAISVNILAISCRCWPAAYLCIFLGGGGRRGGGGFPWRRKQLTTILRCFFPSHSFALGTVLHLVEVFLHRLCTTVYSKWVPVMACSLFMTIVVDQHRFDTYPDSNPNQSFTHDGKLDFFLLLFTALPVSNCRCHNFPYFGQHIVISGKGIVWLKWIQIRIRMCRPWMPIQIRQNDTRYRICPDPNPQHRLWRLKFTVVVVHHALISIFSCSWVHVHKIRVDWIPVFRIRVHSWSGPSILG